MADHTDKLRLALSLAGHDRGRIYIVAGESEDTYMLVNGVTRTRNNPKKKKKMHVQIIHHLNAFSDSIQNIADLSDADVIEAYEHHINKKKQ